MSKSMVRQAESVAVGAVRYKAVGREWSGHRSATEDQIHKGASRREVRQARGQSRREQQGQEQSESARITNHGNRIRNTGRPNGNTCQRKAI
ncbi:unnamed protein product [Staurois parvus]|uniref:Uncharacterized protein n=1 Tax=Staurois parvus TaxID=386267 RepID=A0ABN9GZK6_9NEOB|nr:unnamed protein product [Staurois parvus]